MEGDSEMSINEMRSEKVYSGRFQDTTQYLKQICPIYAPCGHC